MAAAAILNFCMTTFWSNSGWFFCSVLQNLSKIPQFWTKLCFFQNPRWRPSVILKLSIKTTDVEYFVMSCVCKNFIQIFYSVLETLTFSCLAEMAWNWLATTLLRSFWRGDYPLTTAKKLEVLLISFPWGGTTIRFGWLEMFNHDNLRRRRHRSRW